MGQLNTDQSSFDLPSSASFLIDTLPGQPSSTSQSILQYAGHLPSHPPSTLSPPPDSHLWFWLVRSKHIAHREKFVIWLNGGPGCSSAEGALIEIGPLTTKRNTKPGMPIELEESEMSWSEYASLLFIDQPTGTGYSYVNVGDDVRELQQVAEQIVVFLKNFYKIFPEFSKIDTYLAGESYAGQYIPYFAQAILDTAALSTPLLGLLMGNPWLNPRVQYLSYLDVAYEKGLIVKGTSAAKKAEKSFEKCMKSLNDPVVAQRIMVECCENGLQSILDAAETIVNGTKMTPVVYNITELTPDSNIDWPPRVQDLKAYLNQNATVQAFHAGHKFGNWTLCNETIGQQMWAPKSAPSSTIMPGLLKKLKVIIYVGDQDFMCNSVGLNRSISELEWNGQKGWGVNDNGSAIQPQDYYVRGTKEGTWTEARGLSFVQFDHASHLVPTDLPHAAHDMLLRFLEIDPIIAAGPASTIPSQVGAHDLSGIIVKTLLNGTVIEPDKLTNELDKSPALGAAVLETAEERQAYYGPRQTIALILVLLGLILGLVMLFKWRRRRRRNRHLLQVRRQSIPMSPVLPTFQSNRSSVLAHNTPGSSKSTQANRARINHPQESQTLLNAEQGFNANLSAQESPPSPLSNLPNRIRSDAHIFSLEDDDDNFKDD